MIPIRNTSYTSKHESAGNAAVTALHRRARNAKRRTTFKQFWIRFWQRNADRIINAAAIILLFAVILGAFYAGSAYGASL
jgi:hypothetical protein